MPDKCELGYTHDPATGKSTAGCTIKTCGKLFQLTGTKKVKVQKKDNKGNPEVDKKGKPVMEERTEHTWKEVTPTCRLVTRVKFKDGKFEPIADGKIGVGLSCLCLVMDSPCEYMPEVNKKDTKKLEAASCDGGCGGAYYRLKPKDEYTTPNDSDKAEVICTMIIDHEEANKIKCACWVLHP